LKDALYWIPIILLFTGIRLEEATELFIEDIITDLSTDIIYFDINENHHKRLKTEASPRKIPIPKKLIELGFLDYVQKNKRNRQLFERELTVSKAKGKETFSKNVSKNLNRMLQINGINNNGGKKSLHSFRHNFVDATRKANIHPDIMKMLSGHKRDGVIGGYGNDPMLKEKKEALDKLIFAGFPL
jgi:integrase